jgi:hypothetical protein
VRRAWGKRFEMLEITATAENEKRILLIDEKPRNSSCW